MTADGVEFPAAAKIKPFYVLLCRHGPHRGHKLVREGEPATFPTVLVARALRDQLRYPSAHGGDPIRLRCVMHGSADEVQETTRKLVQELRVLWDRSADRDKLSIKRNDGTTGLGQRRPLVLQCEDMDEPRFLASKDDESLAESILAIAAGGSPPKQSERRTVQLDLSKCPEGNAVLVVGHQPHLGWLSDALLRHGRIWRWRSLAVPFGRAELVCLAFPKPYSLRRRWYRRGHVLWSLTPDDKKAAEEVRNKIKSKMDTARTLSAVITFGLGALLGLLLDPTRWSNISSEAPIQIATGLLFASLVLYLASMYSYDRLLMPDRFWGERRPRHSSALDRGRGWLVQRPPSSVAWVLYVNMMRVWRGLFTPATICVVAALIALAAVALQFTARQMIYVGLPAAALVGALVFWFRPVLGSED